MVLSMTRPSRRKTSSHLQFVKRVPTDVLAKARGQAIALSLPARSPGDPPTLTHVKLSPVVKLSLRTRDHDEAKARSGAIEEQLQRVWRCVREGPEPLTLPRALVLARSVYASDVLRMSDGMDCTALALDDSDTEESSERETVGLALGDVADKYVEALSRGVFDLAKPDADALLSAHGYAAAPDSTEYVTLCRLILKARVEALRDTHRRYEGLTVPEHVFSVSPAGGVTPAGAPKSLREMFEAWARLSAKPRDVTDGTIAGYRTTLERFIAFLKHDDASRVTDADVGGFAESRLAAGIKPKTVKGADLAALRSVFGWAVETGRLPRVPGENYKVRVGTTARTRDKGYTDDEAVVILKACRSFKASPQEEARTTAAKRWVPWLCAHSGARLSEIVQLRKKDLVQRTDHWAIVITPDAGSVKNKSYREVPLHQQLIDLGFLDFVKAAPAGGLFEGPAKEERTGRRGGGVRNRLREFVRAVLGDVGVQPMHGWRHRFTTLCRKHGVGDDAQRMITGHAAKDVHAAVYGDPAGLYREISKLPAYPV